MYTKKVQTGPIHLRAKWEDSSCLGCWCYCQGNWRERIAEGASEKFAPISKSLRSKMDPMCRQWQCQIEATTGHRRDRQELGQHRRSNADTDCGSFTSLNGFKRAITDRDCARTRSDPESILYVAHSVNINKMEQEHVALLFTKFAKTECSLRQIKGRPTGVPSSKTVSAHSSNLSRTMRYHRLQSGQGMKLWLSYIVMLMIFKCVLRIISSENERLWYSDD